MEIATRVNGNLTKPMDMASISTLMEQSMRENGLMINNAEPVVSSGQMVAASKVNTRTGGRTARANSHGQMVPVMRVSGRTTRCMDSEYSSGLMVVNIKDTMIMTRNMVKVYSNGPMVRYVKGFGY